jgi:septation ring formation regulator EzrA
MALWAMLNAEGIMASDEVNALKDIAGKIDELGNVGREIDNLKRAVEALTSELKEVRKFAAIKDVLDDTNDNLAKIAEELRKIREKG